MVDARLPDGTGIKLPGIVPKLSETPGAIRTPINAAVMADPELLEPLLSNIPLKRLGTPKDVAGVAAFLASSDADYITGSTVYVDGGLLWDYTERRIRSDEGGDDDER